MLCMHHSAPTLPNNKYKLIIKVIRWLWQRDKEYVIFCDLKEIHVCTDNIRSALMEPFWAEDVYLNRADLLVVNF